MNIFANDKRCLRNSSVRQRVAPTSCADIYDRWYIYDIFLMFYIQWIILPMHCNDKSGWVRSRADLLPRVDLTFSGSLSPSAVTLQDIAHHFVNPEYLLPNMLQNPQSYTSILNVFYRRYCKIFKEISCNFWAQVLLHLKILHVILSIPNIFCRRYSKISLNL